MGLSEQWVVLAGGLKDRERKRWVLMGQHGMVRLRGISGGVLVLCELPKRSPRHIMKLCRQAVTEDNLC